MINYFSTASKKHLPLLNIQINKNFQSRCVVRKIMLNVRKSKVMLLKQT